MKILTVYFSKTGHTKIVAGTIHERVGGDMKEIHTKRKYASSYGMAVIQGGLEQFRKSLPELEEIPDVADYDVIFLGTPVWWFTLAPAVKSFIAASALAGKKVYPFFTSGGQPKDTAEDFRMLLESKRAIMADTLHVSYRGNKLQMASSEIIRWADEKKREFEGHVDEIYES